MIFEHGFVLYAPMPFYQANARSLGFVLRPALVVGLVLLGCSIEARDRLKHFFFEVPGETPPSASTTDESTKPAAPPPDPPAAPGTKFASMHPPFLQRKCGECHDAEARMTPRKDLLDSCKVCHQRHFTPEVGHSPVTQQQCLQCHDPHRSIQPALLKSAIYDLCLQCHDEPALLSPESHSGPDVEKCTACHDPHFGTGKLLKANVGNPLK